MYYVYVIQSSKDKEFYTGYTDNLKRRIREHNQGLVESTENRRPFELIYYEYGGSKEDAIRRESCLKSGRGKRYIASRIRCYMENNRGVCFSGTCPEPNSSEIR